MSHDPPVARREVEITNSLGLHLRPADSAEVAAQRLRESSPPVAPVRSAAVTYVNNVIGGTYTDVSHIRLNMVKTGTPGSINISGGMSVTYRAVAT